SLTADFSPHWFRFSKLLVSHAVMISPSLTSPATELIDDSVFHFFVNQNAAEFGEMTSSATG
ncbi:MAG: hypothetical protein KDA87_19005, partial [Planctomycetales bacterium]|nr:hypothetical protein [Planctomycetales bacterium]